MWLVIGVALKKFVIMLLPKLNVIIFFKKRKRKISPPNFQHPIALMVVTNLYDKQSTS